MKKVSIIIPAYNAASTLEKCYQSILAQTYSNFEVITVNDGSKDNTLEIMQKYSAQDKRFVSVDKPNGGVSSARNEGLKHATGTYLQFVDADDTIDSQMLEKMVNMLRKNRAQLAICRFTHPFFKTYIEKDVYDLRKASELLRLYQDPYAMVVPWNKLWKRKAFTEKFDEEVRFAEDELCNLANIANVKRVATTNEYLYNYYIVTDKNNKEAQNSCIGKISTKLASGEANASFYWFGKNLLYKRKQIIDQAIKNKKLAIKKQTDLSYYRLVDFSFYTLGVYLGMDVSRKEIIKDYINIIGDPEFREAFKLEEKYGFRLKTMTEEENKKVTQKFIALCYRTYKEKAEQQDFKLLYSFMMIFMALFTEQVSELDTINFKAKFLNDFKNATTPEAKYVRGVLA